MDRFLVPAAASIVVGLLLGAAAIFGVTLMVQQDNKPPLQAGDPASSVLNRVEYGDRSLASADATSPLSRRWLWVVAAAALILTFAQSPGQISPDTKLDLTANPAAVPGPRVQPVEQRAAVRAGAEPGLRLPLPARRVLPRSVTCSGFPAG